MRSKRQLLLGAIAVALVTFLLTSSAFLYFFHLVSGNALLALKFFRALHIVQSRYVDDVSTDTLISGAIDGMVKSLKDPHSMYMDGKILKQFMMETSGQFGGIGVIVGVKDNALTVVAPIEGTPGEAAGIKSGDKIIKIDGELTKDMPLDIAVNKIRGLKDTSVELVLIGEDGNEKTVKILRSDIKLKTVASRKLEDGIGYIRLTMFNEHSFEDFKSHLEQLDKQDIKGLVIDMRNNPGGLLDTCVKIAQLLVPKGPIVSIVAHDGSKEVFYSELAQPRYKIVVLVNNGSASASEILAGALQDTQAATVIGTNTYGKGSVQSIMRLDSDSAVKITYAKYFTPSGRVINGVGIKPDIELALAEDRDNQLEKAISVLREKLAQGNSK